MRRLHATAIALLLGGGAVAGAGAALETVHLGAAAAAPAVARVPDRAIAARRAKLVAWKRALAKTRAARPPALPTVPHYPAVRMPTMPALPQAHLVAQTQSAAGHAGERPAPAQAQQQAPQVTYVTPPPTVEYRQAPPAATTTTTTGYQGDDGGYEDDGGSQSGVSQAGGDD